MGSKLPLRPHAVHMVIALAVAFLLISGQPVFSMPVTDDDLTAKETPPPRAPYRSLEELRKGQPKPHPSRPAGNESGDQEQHVADANTPFKVLVSQPVLKFDVPEPIQDAEWQEYAEALNLSEAQRKYADTLYADYRERIDDYRQENYDPLVQGSTELAGGAIRNDPELGEKYLRCLKEADRIRNRTRLFDEELFARLGEVLGAEQLRQLPIVQDRRTRVRQRLILDHAWYPLKAFDLARTVRTLEAEGEISIPASSQEQMRSILRTYESALTQHVVSLANIIWKGKSKIHKINAEGASAISAAENDEDRRRLRDELLRKRRDDRSPILNAAKSIYTLQQQTLLALMPLLSESDGNTVTGVMHAAAFPEVYPNPHNLEVAFEALLQSPDIDGDAATAVMTLWQRHNTIQEGLSTQMVVRFLDWKEYTMLRIGYGRAEYEQYQSEMLLLDHKRRMDCEETIHTLHTISDDPDSPAALAVQDALEPWRQRMARFNDAMAKREHYGQSWPSPY